MKVTKCFILTVLFVIGCSPTSLSGSPVATAPNSQSELKDESTVGSGNKNPFQVFMNQLLRLFQSFWNRRPTPPEENQNPTPTSSSSGVEDLNGKSRRFNDINKFSDPPNSYPIPGFPPSGFPEFQFPSVNPGQFPTIQSFPQFPQIPNFPQFPQVPNFPQFQQFPNFPQYPTYSPPSPPSSSSPQNRQNNYIDDEQTFDERFGDFMEMLKEFKSKIPDSSNLKPNDNNKIQKN